MRMRKKKHTAKRIQACAEYLDYKYMFDSDKINKKIYMEIGCGKGDFICGMAREYPDINFIAVEYISDVIVTAMEKAKNLNLPNVRFINADAKLLEEYIKPCSVSKLYLNFSDPWQKRYQWHFRLTHKKFLDIYKKILTPGAKIILKTDNKDFFDYSVRSLASNGFIIEHQIYDLYNSDYTEGNIQTEYEKKFVEQNIPICYLSAVFSE